MGFWTFYYVVKFFFYYRGFIDIAILYNLLFVTFLLLPVPDRWRSVNRVLKFFKNLLAVGAGLALLWHESFLPDPVVIYDTVKRDGLPSQEYLIGFLGGYFSKDMFIVGFLVLAGTLLLAKYVKTLNIVLLSLFLLIPFKVSGQTSDETLNEYLDDFFSSEELRAVEFDLKRGQEPDFDLIFLHVCSLSWDDLEMIGMRDNQLLHQFDFIFKNFNAATTYSGPAMIRLMNGCCGQPRHENIYENTPPACHLFPNLKEVGFKPQVALNHNGEFGQFTKQLRRDGHLDAVPFTQKGIKQDLVMFDGTPVYDDLGVLKKWLEVRRKDKSGQPVALYYNTVTLHDGVHEEGAQNWGRVNRYEAYRSLAQRLMTDIDQFFNLLEETGRRYVVVFIPEHGMALRGSPIQRSGLRDIPLPAITKVPVGIKLVGPRGPAGLKEKVEIHKPTSYMAVSYLLSSFLEKNPFENNIYTSRPYLDNIPLTEFVAENEGNTSIYAENKYWIQQEGEGWYPYRPGR